MLREYIVKVLSILNNIYYTSTNEVENIKTYTAPAEYIESKLGGNEYRPCRERHAVKLASCDEEKSVQHAPL